MTNALGFFFKAKKNHAEIKSLVVVNLFSFFSPRWEKGDVELAAAAAPGPALAAAAAAASVKITFEWREKEEEEGG